MLAGWTGRVSQLGAFGGLSRRPFLRTETASNHRLLPNFTVPIAPSIDP
jgi:hypothetical protein